MKPDRYLNKQKFIDAAKAKIPSFDADLVSRSWDFAKNAHNDQRRDSGESYFSHPVGVAYTLLDINCDSITIAAALLHDVVEDTMLSLREIEDSFGPEVAMLVDGVTKLTTLDSPPEKPWSKDDKRIADLRKLFVNIA